MPDFDKAKVTIDLDEYLALKEASKEKSKEFDYDEAYSILIQFLEEKFRNPIINGNDLDQLNRSQGKYSFAEIVDLHSRKKLIVRLNSNYKLQNRISD